MSMAASPSTRCIFAQYAAAVEKTDAAAEKARICAERIGRSYPSRSAPTSVTSVCAACGAVCTKKCARCKAVFYCSPAWQRQHWTTGGHKTVCVPAAAAAVALATGAGAAATAAPTPTPADSNASEVAAVSAASVSLMAESTAKPLASNASEVAVSIAETAPSCVCLAPQPSNASEVAPDAVCGQPSPLLPPSNAAEEGGASAAPAPQCPDST